MKKVFWGQTSSTIFQHVFVKKFLKTPYKFQVLYWRELERERERETRLKKKKKTQTHYRNSGYCLLLGNVIPT